MSAGTPVRPHDADDAVDEAGMASFPASDPPATWTWDVEEASPPRAPWTEDLAPRQAADS